MRPEGAKVIDIAVLAAHRGQGVATQVLSDLHGGADVKLPVFGSNVDARRLYERLGFKVTGDTGGYVSMMWPSDE